MNIEPTPMAARLAKIMGEIGRVEKKGNITSTGYGPTYKFAKDSDVLEVVTPKMAEAGIVMIPEHVELLSMGLTLTEKQFIANIKTSWHVTDGKESLRFETFGQGADTSDKALPKAQSNARKYAFFMLYHIVTGDDPDHYASEPSPERGRSAAQRAPAPAPRTAEEQALADELLNLTAARGHEYQSQLADQVGVAKGTRANADELRAMIVLAVEKAAGIEPVARTGESSEPEGGTPPSGTPPKPRTVEEAIADAERKATKAKVVA